MNILGPQVTERMREEIEDALVTCSERASAKIVREVRAAIDDVITRWANFRDLELTDEERRELMLLFWNDSASAQSEIDAARLAALFYLRRFHSDVIQGTSGICEQLVERS